MTHSIYAVEEDSTIVTMTDIDEEEIVNMIGSDYYPAVFRLINGVVEYAVVDLDTITMTWRKPTEKER